MERSLVCVRTKVVESGIPDMKIWKLIFVHTLKRGLIDAHFLVSNDYTCIVWILFQLIWFSLWENIYECVRSCQASKSDSSIWKALRMRYQRVRQKIYWSKVSPTVQGWPSCFNLICLVRCGSIRRQYMVLTVTRDRKNKSLIQEREIQTEAKMKNPNRNSFEKFRLEQMVNINLLPSITYGP